MPLAEFVSGEGVPGDVPASSWCEKADRVTPGANIAPAAPIGTGFHRERPWTREAGTDVQPRPSRLLGASGENPSYPSRRLIPGAVVDQTEATSPPRSMASRFRNSIHVCPR